MTRTMMMMNRYKGKDGQAGDEQRCRCCRCSQQGCGPNQNVSGNAGTEGSESVPLNTSTLSLHHVAPISRHATARHHHFRRPGTMNGMIRTARSWSHSSNASPSPRIFIFYHIPIGIPCTNFDPFLTPQSITLRLFDLSCPFPPRCLNSCTFRCLFSPSSLSFSFRLFVILTSK